MGDVPWGKVGAGALHYNADGRQVKIASTITTPTRPCNRNVMFTALLPEQQDERRSVSGAESPPSVGNPTVSWPFTAPAISGSPRRTCRRGFLLDPIERRRRCLLIRRPRSHSSSWPPRVQPAGCLYGLLTSTRGTLYHLDPSRSSSSSPGGYLGQV